MKHFGLMLVCIGVLGCGAADTDFVRGVSPAAAVGLNQRMGMGGPSLEHLGQMLFFDANLSLNGDQSCATCHGANMGWTGPDGSLNVSGSVYEGSASGRFGNRKPPSSAYAMRSPIFAFDAQNGFFGGNFSDGRATGWSLGSAVADQARGPFLNPVEQALPDASALVERVCAVHYGRMFRRLWGESACDDVEQGYADIALSIAAFESSARVSPYSAKYDAVLRAERSLSAAEQRGLELFNGKAHCSTCHSSQAAADGGPPVFSDFGYDNIGVPKNPDNPFYGMDAVAVAGEPINPEGASWIDPGLGGFVEKLATQDAWRDEPYVSPSVLQLSAAKLTQLARDARGKHRVPTLRNVDLRPSPSFVKAYTHNGYFKSLQSLVHFYNTRDVLPRCKGSLTEDQALTQQCWPAPEVEGTVDTTLIGNLGLTTDEEQALVAFLQTLSDAFEQDLPMSSGMHGGGMHGGGMHGGGMHGGHMHGGHMQGPP